MSDGLRVAAKWTDDCSGKKDYDGHILQLSTRYWPRGGGFFILKGGEFEGNGARPEIKPSARSSLLIYHHAEPDTEPDYETLIEREFNGETFEEVAAQVEAWGQSQVERAVSALRAEFQRRDEA